MSIFGQLDAANIRTNPYFIEKGEYEAQVTKAFLKTKDDGQRNLVIEFTIDQTDSKYYDKKVSKYFKLVDEDLDEEKFALLDSDTQRQIENDMSAVKRFLCGNETNDKQKGLGVDPEELNDGNWKPETLVGIKAVIGINNYGPNNQNVAINWANIID